MKRIFLAVIAAALFAGVIGFIAGYRIALIEERSYGASNIQWRFCEAASRGDVRALQRLHAAGATINGEPIGWKPGRIPASMLDTLGYLAVGRSRMARNISGFPALSNAASGGHTDAVRWLLENGAAVNASPNTTPLASAKHRLEQTKATIKLLTEHGAE
jgi:hypothetical protein